MPPKLFPKSLVPSIIGLFIISCVVQAHAGYDSGTEPGLCPGGDLSIEQIVPEEGTVGTMVAVRGHGFTDEVNVWLGDVDLGIQASISPELIVIEVPEIAVDGSTDEADCGFSVMNLVVKNLPTHQCARREDAFKYWYRNACPVDEWPAIETVEPNIGTVGTGVTIHGYNFVPDTVVFFGWMPAWPVEFISENELRVEAPQLPRFLVMIEIFPPPPITVDIAVVNLNNGLWDRLQDGFTYEAIPPGPTVEQVVPDAGPPGIEAIVMVDGFGEEVAVYFGPMEAEVLDRPSLEEIVVCVPERHYCGTWCEDNERIDPDCRSESDGTEGYDDESAWPCWEHTVPVTVVDLAAGISATNPWAFTYTPVPCPMIEEIVPCEGPAGILATVMIRGFSEAVSVYFGGRTAPVCRAIPICAATLHLIGVPNTTISVRAAVSTVHAAGRRSP